MEKKRKLEEITKMHSKSFVTKDYLGEYSFKTSPNKMGKPDSKSSPFKPVPEVTKKNTKSSPFKRVPEETKKETVKKMENVEKIEKFRTRR
jgi:hypothetical protein